MTRLRAGPSQAHCHALLGLFRYATRNAQPRDASVRQANSLRRECLSLPVSRIARARPQPDDVDCDVVLKNGTYTPSWRPLAWRVALVSFIGYIRGYSAVASASALHAEGPGFEPRYLQRFLCFCKIKKKFRIVIFCFWGFLVLRKCR